VTASPAGLAPLASSRPSLSSSQPGRAGEAHLRLLCLRPDPAARSPRGPAQLHPLANPWQHTQQQLLFQQPLKHQQPASQPAVANLRDPVNSSSSLMLMNYHSI